MSADPKLERRIHSYDFCTNIYSFHTFKIVLTGRPSYHMKTETREKTSARRTQKSMTKR